MPANEVWGKVIFSEACVKNSVHRRGAGSRGVPAQGGCLLGGGGLMGVPGGDPLSVCSAGLLPGVCLVETPWDGYCCGRYASYWNAFLLSLNSANSVKTSRENSIE